MSKQDIILGIDLGTTTSEGCIYTNNNIKMIKNEDGDDIIPSVVALSPSSKKIIVGNEAKAISEGNPKNVITEVKRLPGSFFYYQVIIQYFDPLVVLLLL